jgi:hypothetical protein
LTRNYSSTYRDFAKTHATATHTATQLNRLAVSGNYKRKPNLHNMKKFLLLLLTITTLTVNGQYSLLGLKGGGKLSNTTSSIFKDHNNRTGIVIGLTFDYIIKNNFSAGIDINYNQRGFTTNAVLTDDYGNPIGKTNTKFYYDYITLPLKAGYIFGKTIYGFASIGFTTSLLIDAKHIESANLNGTIISDENINVTDKVNKLDFGGLAEVGGGYKIKERYWLFMSLSFDKSFSTISNSDYFADSKIRHYGMSLNLGLRYKLTKR